MDMLVNFPTLLFPGTNYSILDNHPSECMDYGLTVLYIVVLRPEQKEILMLCKVPDGSVISVITSGKGFVHDPKVMGLNSGHVNAQGTQSICLGSWYVLTTNSYI